MNKNKQHLQRRPKLLRSAYGRRGLQIFFQKKIKEKMQRRPELLRGAYGLRGVHVFFFKKKSKTKSSDGLNYYAALTDFADGAYNATLTLALSLPDGRMLQVGEAATTFFLVDAELGGAGTKKKKSVCLLLYMCPHTARYAGKNKSMLYAICICMCLHTAVYVS